MKLELLSPAPLPLSTTSTLPIRRHHSVEVPAAGLWPIQTSSHIVHTTRRGRREQLAISNGWLDLDDDPANCWLHIEMAGRRFDLTADVITDDSHGLSAWHLTGVADSGDRRDSMSMDLRYHGVFRRGDLMWAWFSGTAVVESAGRRDAERLHLDLSFQASSAQNAAT